MPKPNAPHAADQILDSALRTAAWDALVADPAIGVSVEREDGFTIYCSARQAIIFGGDAAKPEAFMGKPWNANFPKDWIEERLALLQQTKSTGKPVILRTIWRGKQQFSLVRQIEGDSGELARFLVITRRVSDGDLLPGVEPGLAIKDSDVANLGPLATLTTRELEVLALIGQGHTSKEMAAILFRSEKTIENHRHSISKKLERASAIELATIAAQAGLRVDDAKRRRI